MKWSAGLELQNESLNIFIGLSVWREILNLMEFFESLKILQN